MSVHEEGLLIQVKTLFIHERCTDMLDAGRRTRDSNITLQVDWSSASTDGGHQLK